MEKSPEEKAWEVMVKKGLLETYDGMDDEKVKEIMKGERELPDTERLIQDYLVLIGKSLEKSE